MLNTVSKRPSNPLQIAPNFAAEISNFFLKMISVHNVILLLSKQRKNFDKTLRQTFSHWCHTAMWLTDTEWPVKLFISIYYLPLQITVKAMARLTKAQVAHLNNLSKASSTSHKATVEEVLESEDENDADFIPVTPSQRNCVKSISAIHSCLFKRSLGRWGCFT